MHLLIVIATEGDKESAPHLIICLQNRWQWWEIRQFLIPMFVWRCPNIKETEGATLGWQIYGCKVDGAVNEVQGSESIWRKRNYHCFGSHHVVGFFDDGPNKVLLMGQSHFLMCPQLDWKYSYKPKAAFLTSDDFFDLLVIGSTHGLIQTKPSLGNVAGRSQNELLRGIECSLTSSYCPNTSKCTFLASNLLQ